MKFHVKIATAEMCIQVQNWQGVLACGLLAGAWVLTTVFGFYPVMP